MNQLGRMLWQGGAMIEAQERGRWLWLGAWATLVLGGCISLAPDYKRPNAPVPAQLPAGAEAAADAQAAADGEADRTAMDVPYDTFIQDPRLTEVIGLALEQSRSLRQTAQAVVSARALYAGEDAARWPLLQAEATSTHGKTVVSALGSTTVTQERYSFGLGFSAFELDLFGRLANLTDAAQEQAMASEQAYRAARITLIGEVAAAWVALAADRARLALAESTAANTERAVALTKERVRNGLSARVDLRQAEMTYESARADIALYTTEVAQARNALELLVGQPVGDGLLPEPLAAEQQWFARVPVGMSSAVLLQRPDVMQAEHMLKAAHANIGAARAAFFPTLSLTGSAGLAATDLSAVTSGDMGKVWTLSPSLTLPIFDGGRNAANLEYQKSERKRLVAGYELAIQTAFREVADALSRRQTIVAQVRAHDAQVVAAQDNFDLAEARYRKGVDGYLLTLDAQRSLYSAQQLLIGSFETELSNRVTLYRVLGGGLAVAAAEVAAAPSEEPEAVD